MTQFLRVLAIVAVQTVIFFQSAVADINKLVVIVPVYRELYNQNIAALLESLYNQDLKSLPIDKIDAWFIVNNTVGASSDIRTENQETVTFLTAIAAGRVPSVRAEHRLLGSLAQKKLSERLNIFVVDETTPGRSQRNIGAVRDFGWKKVQATIESGQLSNVLIAQMDADTSFGPQYARTLIEAFERDNLKFTLNTMPYADQPDSERRVYQRKVTTDFISATNEFRLATDGAMPGGGGPRITATASAMVGVGGIPHEVMGEDVALIKKLAAQFPGKGRFIDNPVSAKYRAREDGYDANYYLKNLSAPIEFDRYDEYVRKLTTSLAHFHKDPWLKSLYDEAFEQHMLAHRSSVSRLRNLVYVNIFDAQNGVQSIQPAANYPAIMGNRWFQEEIVSHLATHAGDPEKVMADLIKDFPYHFADPPPEAQITIAKFKAATQMILQRPNLATSAARAAALPLLRTRFPKLALSISEALAIEAAAAEAERKKAPARAAELSHGEILNRLYSAKGDEPGVCAKCGRHHQNPLLKAGQVNVGALRAIVQNKRPDDFEPQTRDHLLEVATKHLDAQFNRQDFSTDFYEREKDLMRFADYVVIPARLITKVASATTNWSRQIRELSVNSSPDGFGRYKCRSCGKYHQTERPPTVPDGMNVAFLESIVSELRKEKVGFSSGAAQKLMVPLLAVYRELFRFNRTLGRLPSAMEQEETKFLNIESDFKQGETCNRIFR